MATFDITRVSVNVQDQTLQKRTPNEFDIETVSETVQVHSLEKRTRNTFGVVELGPDILSTFTVEKRERLSFGVTEVEETVGVESFDRLSELAARFTDVRLELEFEDTGEPVEDGLYVFTPGGFTAVAEINNSVASLTLLNEKPVSEFFVIVEEEGTAFLDFAFHVAGTTPGTINPPGDTSATLTVREPALSLGSVMGAGTVEELLRQLLSEEISTGLSG